MQLIDLIRTFVHDVDSTRWGDDYIPSLIEEAKYTLNLTALMIINDREIKRNQARLNSIESVTNTISIQLVDGVDVYNLPDDTLQIISVRYNGRYIPHKHTSNSITTDDEVNIFSYNVDSEADNKFRISPMPKTRLVLEDNETKFKLSSAIADYPFNFDCTKDIPIATDAPCECTIDDLIDLQYDDSYKYYGWGSIQGNTISPLTLNIVDNVTSIEVKDKDVTVEFKDNILDVNLSTLEVTYKTKKEIMFSTVNSKEDIIKELTNNTSLIKYYVTSILLRNDSDSASINLGNQELTLFNNYLDMYKSIYNENYIVDDKLKIIHQELPKYKDSSSLLVELQQHSKIAELTAIKDKAILDLEVIKFNMSKLDLDKDKLKDSKERQKQKHCTTNKYTTL